MSKKKFKLRKTITNKQQLNCKLCGKRLDPSDFLFHIAIDHSIEYQNYMESRGLERSSIGSNDIMGLRPKSQESVGLTISNEI